MHKKKFTFSNIESFFASLQKNFLDALFPICCLGCGTFDSWLCTSCHIALPTITDQHCPCCKKNITPNGELCFACMQNHSVGFDGVFVASSYHDPLLKKVIHYYKYRFVRDLAKPLALLLAQSLHNSHMIAPDIIIPIPLHSRRLRWRGFNQAEELARALDLQIPINTDILKRVRYTAPQVSMKNKIDRQKNIKNAFCVTPAHNIEGQKILLIDDIMTTGTTLSECATVLKKSGAQSVHCLVIARE